MDLTAATCCCDVYNECKHDYYLLFPVCRTGANNSNCYKILADDAYQQGWPRGSLIGHYYANPSCEDPSESCLEACFLLECPESPPTECGSGYPVDAGCQDPDDIYPQDAQPLTPTCAWKLISTSGVSACSQCCNGDGCGGDEGLPTDQCDGQVGTSPHGGFALDTWQCGVEFDECVGSHCGYPNCKFDIVSSSTQPETAKCFVPFLTSYSVTQGEVGHYSTLEVTSAEVKWDTGVIYNGATNTAQYENDGALHARIKFSYRWTEDRTTLSGVCCPPEPLPGPGQDPNNCCACGPHIHFNTCNNIHQNLFDSECCWVRHFPSGQNANYYEPTGNCSFPQVARHLAHGYGSNNAWPQCDYIVGTGTAYRQFKIVAGWDGDLEILPDTTGVNPNTGHFWFPGNAHTPLSECDGPECGGESGTTPGQFSEAFIHGGTIMSDFTAPSGAQTHPSNCNGGCAEYVGTATAKDYYYIPDAHGGGGHTGSPTYPGNVHFARHFGSESMLVDGRPYRLKSNHYLDRTYNGNNGDPDQHTVNPEKFHHITWNFQVFQVGETW